MMKKTALITGASSGIGKEFSYQLAKKGMNVVLVARNKEALDQLAEEIIHKYKVEATVVTADLSVEYAARDISEKLKEKGLEIDYLVNNAGFGTSGEFLGNPKEMDHKQVTVNVQTIVDLTHEFLPTMVKKGEGTIINVASIVSFQPVPYMAVYSATKSFVLSFTESLAEEYRSKGITFFAICPGPTDTNFFQSAGDPTPSVTRTPKQVVQTALKGIDQGKSYAIDGKKNYFLAQSPRLFPRKMVAQLSAKVSLKSMK
ncbi:SDR family oxidoreductase [Rossellomorea aquimaris]|uniref:SDR family NAD(P)-dependent oxidoreductase n=1 Tax=Rossellomorea aquimaris TaxID=189382 RepID=UPI001CD27042|nr:SDR family oxidoreductase [Rossellomorea aquimaris]MCA1057606.1 SDR family oxidoreductase [Rossellomorea aquimaris]